MSSTHVVHIAARWNCANRLRIKASRLHNADYCAEQESLAPTAAVAVSVVGSTTVSSHPNMVDEDMRPLETPIQSESGLEGEIDNLLSPARPGRSQGSVRQRSRG